ncbi:MAG: hypothetical protein WC374_04685 [Phycisphaerae bacterium]|jgi:hypothetical protein
MTQERARNAAEEKVFVYMNRADIEQECKKRGIKAKTRTDMERQLIKALTEDYMRK